MMQLDNKAILQQIDSALEEWVGLGEDLTDVPYFQYSRITNRVIATIERLTQDGSPYRQNARKIIEKYGIENNVTTTYLIGILQALREDYERGYIRTIEELIHANLFGDFLEMADYFLTEGHKDPAAVIAGGVLEEHLRKLCQKNNIPTIEPTKSGQRPKKAESMNVELAGANVYSKLDQKSVTAWLDLRNKAAHARYGEYVQEQVGLMRMGIRDFITRHPA
jgi:hypothetical protein